MRDNARMRAVIRLYIHAQNEGLSSFSFYTWRLPTPERKSHNGEDASALFRTSHQYLQPKVTQYKVISLDPVRRHNSSLMGIV